MGPTSKYIALTTSQVASMDSSRLQLHAQWLNLLWKSDVHLPGHFQHAAGVTEHNAMQVCIPAQCMTGNVASGPSVAPVAPSQAGCCPALPCPALPCPALPCPALSDNHDESCRWCNSTTKHSCLFRSHVVTPSLLCRFELQVHQRWQLHLVKAAMGQVQVHSISIKVSMG